MEKCYNSKGQQIPMSEPHEAAKKFDDWSKMQSPPFAMYANTEAILVKREHDSNILQRHEPCNVGSYLVPHKDLVYYQTSVKFHEGRCVEDFCKYLQDECRSLYKYAKQNCNKPQLRDPLERLIFVAASECAYCSKQFTATQKVWHHCHISG